MPESTAKVRVGATNNDPELTETIPITQAKDPRLWRVVMRLGRDTKSDDPMPDLRPGDKLIAYAELEVTTDAKDKKNPGLIGAPYSYSPQVDARLLLARERDRVEPQAGKSIVIGRWGRKCSHERHHEVVEISASEVTVPARWSGDGFVNLALSASHASARPGQKLLIGENEDRPAVDQNISGIRLVRLRPGEQPAVKATRHARLAARSVRVAKKPTVVLSMPLDGLKRNEQLLVRGRLVANAADVGYHARLSARMFLADDPKHLEPKGHVEDVASWKGHLSKENGTNCLNGEGPRTRRKFGTLRMKRDARHRLWVNVVATSSAPFLPNRTPGDPLPMRPGTVLEVVRYRPAMFG
jgi:hypothetical protein